MCIYGRDNHGYPLVNLDMGIHDVGKVMVNHGDFSSKACLINIK